jgi:nucleotide-binding universal stress UspA family protein
MRILIGYDGSPCADEAITDLGRAGLPADGTEAVVLSVADVPPPPAPDDPGPGGPAAAMLVLRDVARVRALVQRTVDGARAAAERAAARVRELFPAWSVRAEAGADVPHVALIRMAAEWRADLVVVGSQGRSALGRVLLGSVSQQVLHHAPCSVRVGRRGERLPEPRVRLVLGFDGSLDSATAASAVAARDWPPQSEVLVVGVVDSRVILNHLESNPPDAPSPAGAAADASSNLREALAGVCDDLRHSGIAATTTVLAGDAKKVLLQEAERSAADCIVLGAKGHTRMERLLLGSVSATVAARAHCSVEVVRAG